MNLLFELRPVEHLEASVDYYRGLGLDPIGWPDDDTALLAAPHHGAVAIALVRDPAESALGAGGVYDVGDLDAFYDAHPELDWLIAPSNNSLGRYAVFADRTGLCIRLLESRPHRASAAGPARLAIAV